MGRNNQQRRAARARERARARTTEPAGAASRSGVGAGRSFFGRDAGAGSGSSVPWSQGVTGAQGVAGGGAAGGSPSLRDRVRAAVDAAVQDARIGDARQAGAACEELCLLATGAAGCRVVAGVLVESLGTEVDWAWQHGWQPADLLRLAGRQIEQPAAVAVVADAIAHDLARYAPSTVAPRWSAQMREHEAGVWWSGESDHVSARASAEAGGMAVVVAAAVAGIAFLRRLPALPRLDPLPGTATARPADEAPIDERILSRVRAFLAKAEATPYEAEADAFTAAAQQLMARHSIDAAMLAAGGVGGGGRGGAQTAAIRIGIDRPYEAPKASLLQVVARANRCKTVWSQGLGFSTVVGFEADLVGVETLFTSLLVQATSAMAGHGRQQSWTGTSRTRSFRRSFLDGFAYRIGQRLADVTAAETAAAAERERAAAERERAAHAGDPADGARRAGRSRDLVVVLGEREAAVDAAIADLFPELTSRRTRQVSDAIGWSAGVHAADQAALRSGAQVETGRA